jgi:hypothetical protein
LSQNGRTSTSLLDLALSPFILRKRELGSTFGVGAQQVFDEHQEPGGGGDPAAPVLVGQVIAERVLEAKPPEEVVEDR